MRSTVRALKCERGFTLVELLVFMMTALVVLAAATTLLIVVVRSQPRISDRNFAIQQGRVLQERFARELRQSSLVEQTPAPTSSSITFQTYVRRSQCGGALETDPTRPCDRLQGHLQLHRRRLQPYGGAAGGTAGNAHHRAADQRAVEQRRVRLLARAAPIRITSPCSWSSPRRAGTTP